MQALRDKIRRVIKLYRPKMLNTHEHGPWEIMHQIVAYGVKTEIREGGPDGEPVTAIGWLAFNLPAAKQRLFYLSGDKLRAATGPGLQGHEGQFLAMMAQAKLVRDYPLQVQGKDFQLEDLIRYEQETCRSGSELTFKLIGLVHYLKSDAKWKDRRGGQWSIPRLIREEIAQPIRGTTCGGTHRLFALSYAVHRRAKRGEPIVGQWARAKKYIEDYHRYTFYLQNADGSFSTEWFGGKGSRKDIDRRLQTSGHILEWLVFSLPKQRLTDPRMLKATNYLADLLLSNPDRRWETGPLGHAVHALILYDQRMFDAQARRAAESELDQSEAVTAETAARETSAGAAANKAGEPAASESDGADHRQPAAADGKQREADRSVQPERRSVLIRTSNGTVLVVPSELDQWNASRRGDAQSAADGPSLFTPTRNARSLAPDRQSR